MISGKSISRTVPKGQQYITEGTHEAIVSREEFEKAQLVINNRNKVVMGSVDFHLREKFDAVIADELWDMTTTGFSHILVQRGTGTYRADQMFIGDISGQ